MVECDYSGCDRPRLAKGLCSGHYQQINKYGIALQPLKFKRGEGHITPTGYRRVQKNKRSRYEHQWVMEEALGRELYRHESVHHKNGDRLDNRIDNLELWSKVQPAGQRVDDKINYAVEILLTYREELINEKHL